MVVAAKSQLPELQELACKIRKAWPDVAVDVDFETSEGEDAYLWISARRPQLDAVRVFASGLTNRLWKKTGLHVVPRMCLQRGR